MITGPNQIRHPIGVNYETLEGGITRPLEILRENDMRSLVNNAEMFVPDEDVTTEDEHGITVQVAVKGVPMPLTEAKRLGLVDVEIKQTKPAANKAKKPAENKSKGGDD